MTDTQSVPGHGQGGGQLPPITDPYLTVGGDSLSGIAERAGHPGEWRALAIANIGAVDDDELSDEAKVHFVAERAGRAGTELVLPSEWAAVLPGADVMPAGEGTQALDQLTASQLAQLAHDAQTLAELDAIDAVAAGRVTVTNAVDARRTVLLDQGATA